MFDAEFEFRSDELQPELTLSRNTSQVPAICARLEYSHGQRLTIAEQRIAQFADRSVLPTATEGGLICLRRQLRGCACFPRLVHPSEQ